MSNYKSKREFIETGCITEKTQEHRECILAMDELFLEDDQSRQQQENEEHQQQEESENGN